MKETAAKNLLFAVADALKEAGLPFCLGAGTLLGAIREDRFIPIDRDIDLWARAEEFEPRVPLIVGSLRKRGLIVDVIDHRHAGYWDGRPYAVKFSGYGEHGDLTAFTKMPGNIRYNPTHGSKKPFCIVFEADGFDLWADQRFYSRCFKVPCFVETILTQLYDNWKVPYTVYDQPCVRRAYKPNFLTKQNIAYVPMCLDLLHPGHLNVLARAKSLIAEKVWIGLVSDAGIGKYKRLPLLDYHARLVIATQLRSVDGVVCHQDYLTALLEHKPAYVVHGDDWKQGPQVASRQLVLDLLPHWGGELVEVPYTPGYSSSELKGKMQ